MVTVKDINDNLHNSCPRCHSDWDEINKELIVCAGDECGMMCCLHDKFSKLFFLCIDIFDYTIYWQKDRCMIDRKNIEEISYSDDHESLGLPLLPFDITLEKLKTYLTFS